LRRGDIDADLELYVFRPLVFFDQDAGGNILGHVATTLSVLDDRL